jgi:NAD(P)H-hydrate epimerase
MGGKIIRPFLTKEQMKKVDDLAVLRGMKILQLMENAGYQIADFFRKNHKPCNVLSLAGKGNNGGDALVTGRRLLGYGYNVKFILAETAIRLKDDSKHQVRALQSMRAEMNVYEKGKHAQDFEWANLILDGLIGYNLKGDPRTGYKDLIELANQSNKEIIAIDIPSGLDANTGEEFNPCIRAKCTITLALPKMGLAKNINKVGTLYLADIGIPLRIFEELGAKIQNPFTKESLLEVRV